MVLITKQVVVTELIVKYYIHQPPCNLLFFCHSIACIGTAKLTFNLLHPNDNQEGLFEKDLYGRTYYKKNDDDKGTTKQKDKKKKKEGSKKADGTGPDEENKDNSGGKAI